jgi:HprK-related kinase A
VRFQRLADLSSGEIIPNRLAIRTGPFVFEIKTTLAELVKEIRLLYAEHEASAEAAFADFHVAIDPARGLRRWILPQIDFSFDGEKPFGPLPREQAAAMLEWGMNWCIHNHAHTWLIIHAAALEKDGRAVILAAPPGSGKSTLCAGLALRGWRLMSDELALVTLDAKSILPLARPISLKNQSIEVVRSYDPSVVLGGAARDTVKGTVALMKPPAESVRRSSEAAKPAWIVFPKWQSGAPARLTPRGKASTFIELGRNAFNYSVLGRRGFDVLASLVDHCGCYDFEYSALDEACAIFAALSAE